MFNRWSGRSRLGALAGVSALAAVAVLGGRSLPTHAATDMSGTSSTSYAPVTDSRLANAASDPGWLMYRGTYDGAGYSKDTQIDASNVASLKPVFTYDTGFKQGHEAPPIVNGRFMYVTTPLDNLIAMDAVTGKVLWKYDHKLPPVALKTVCCDVVNRGVALYGDKVYMSTLDNYVIAFDAQTGKVAWKKQLFAPGVGYAMTSAPLIADGKLITGIAGGEYGARCFIQALDPNTGASLWKFYTVPSPNQPGGNTWKPGEYKTGGGSSWITGSYDPDTKTVFWGVGNPGPWLADLRPGANLYTDSVVALDPESGKLKWHYQFTPHDTWDYDSTSEMILADIPYDGQTVKALVHADRNGNVYALDRSDGKFLWAKPFVKATSVVGFSSDGTPETAKAKYPHLGTSIFTCPSFLGGTNWYPPAYNPDTHMLYLPSNQWCMTMKGVGTDYKAGLPYLGESFKVVPQPGAQYGRFQAIDMSDGKQVWKYDTKLPDNSPALATAGGLVFAGTIDNTFNAFDAKSGKILWSYKTNSGVVGVPTTYMIDGKQYVAVFAGYGGATPIWAPAANTGALPTGGRLYVFALPKTS